VQCQHRRAGFPLVFAGIDLSWNEYIPPKIAPFWQGQVYGVVVGLDAEAVKSAIKHLYPPAASIARPFQATDCSDLPEALSYAIKPAFVRRVSYIDYPRRPPLKPWLKGPQLREMAMSLGRYKLPVRYALTGCKLYSDRIDLYPDARKNVRSTGSDGPRLSGCLRRCPLLSRMVACASLQSSEASKIRVSERVECRAVASATLGGASAKLNRDREAI